MLKDLLDNLFPQADEQAENRSDRRKMAAAVLLVEIASADHDVDAQELDSVLRTLSEQFGLAPADARALLEQAQAEHAEHISLEPYVTALNEHADRAEKRDLLEALWRVAYADGHLHRYEEHMLRRIAELLFLPQQDFIQTKLKVTGQE